MDDFFNSINDVKLKSAFKEFFTKLDQHHLNRFLKEIFLIEIKDILTSIRKEDLGNTGCILIIADHRDLDIQSLTGLLAHLYGLWVTGAGENIITTSALQKDIVADDYASRIGFTKELLLFRSRRPYLAMDRSKLNGPFLACSDYNNKLELEYNKLLKLDITIFYTRKFSMAIPALEITGKTFIVVADYDNKVGNVQNLLSQAGIQL